MRRSLVVVLGLALAASAAATAQRAPRQTPPSSRAAAPRRELPVPFKVGETLTYDVSWSSYLTAGTAVLTVREKKPSFNSTAYYIVAEGRPTPLVSKLYSLYYKMDTLLDSYTLLPQRGSIYSEEGGQHHFRETTFDRAARRAAFENRSTSTVKSDLVVPPDVQDALSALYVLRAVPFRAGDRMTMPVSDSGKNYKLVLQVAGPERLKTSLGELAAWRLRPIIYDADNQPVGRDISIWLSDDARRLPLKLQGDLPVGSFVLSLRDAK
ncbi:MAG: hypothetical protein A3G76_10335 [Acidobacteria bacterium RIFCSPLOWO2_12_FULL_65_11]|nr:MAG: hypothetical protein A3H95_14615 [Acidobacteria bacterium RIFCSPLOWO2_02_FULL_64_15]OFW31671.1 MAG: hypothetical protein A3G76_10335 [Acidobacteria bacterium RIFCSPLOWO2_12_FULL_65_11]